jgi:cellulose synthase operon protein C
VTWAYYMIGRISAKKGSFRKAERAFMATRRLARSGAPDPLGLAVSSYGEQARLHLDRAKSLVSAVKEGGPSAALFGQAVAAAVRLYSRQAAHGSESGVNSLRRIAIWLTNDEALVTASLDQTITQRLLAAYLLVRLDQLASSIRDYNSDSDRADLARQENLLPRLVGAIETIAAVELERADILAALCYRSGEYRLAERLALKSQSPLSAWVKAKLALLHGDRRAAASFYAEATKGWSDPSSAGAPEQVRLLQGEAAILALSRRLYLDALRDLHAAGYWPEMSMIAERVATTDELRTFVGIAAGSDASKGTQQGRELSHVLARRLMRQHRFAEASQYFRSPEAKELTARYADSLRVAKDRSRRPSERARSWYQAAKLAREKGMELMGYEGPPDFAQYDGAYAPPHLVKLNDPFVSPDERRRFNKHRPKPDRRYHYRFVAVEHAKMAADLLPRRSEAFAAILCEAAGWMRVTPGGEPQMRTLYQRYVREGTFWPWASSFAVSCPAPRFD